jgi:predicted RNase H-like nuclease (RuvC/YqgF family)
MRVLGIVVTVLCAGTLLLVGCGKPAEEEPVTTEDVRQEVEEAAETGAQYALQKKQEYQEALEKKLAALDKKTDTLKAQMAALTEETKARVEENLKVVERQREIFAQRLEALGGASAGAWEEMKEGLETAWKDLEEAYGKAAAAFKEQAGAALPT